MKSVNRKVVWLSLISIYIGLVVVWVNSHTSNEEPVFETVLPVYGYIAATVTATGTIQPLDTVSVGTQVSGTINIINADFNSIVRKGQLLAGLDKSLLQAEVDRNTASLRMQLSQLAFDKNNFDRQSELYPKGAVSKLEYERALNAYYTASFAVEATTALLKASKKNLSYADIYAPIDGVILSRNVSLGQTIAAVFNTPTLFVIAKDITKMQVQAAVDEADIGNVSQGQRVVFTVDAFADESFNGTVSEIRLHPKVASNVVSYTTIIEAPNASKKLKPGMTANITIFTREVHNTVKIPVQALSFSPDSALRASVTLKTIAPSRQTYKEKASSGLKDATVWLHTGNVLQQRQITTGISDNKHIQVLSGLDRNDKVIIANLSSKLGQN